MNPDSINKECELNKVKDSKLERRFETEKYPDERQIGTKRHFFTKLLE